MEDSVLTMISIPAFLNPVTLVVDWPDEDVCALCSRTEPNRHKYDLWLRIPTGAYASSAGNCHWSAFRLIYPAAQCLHSRTLAAVFIPSYI